MLSFEKRRESWKLDGCSVELDEVPYLGVYVEIEGPSEADVLRVREKIKLAEVPIIRTSYIAMLMTYMQEKGQVQREVRFT